MDHFKIIITINILVIGLVFRMFMLLKKLQQELLQSRVTMLQLHLDVINSYVHIQDKFLVKKALEKVAKN